MRNNFDRQLDQLNDELITMGALCESAIAASVKALLNSDPSLASVAVGKEKDIARKEREIESLCMRLLLQQQPVARDLRLISSALKMITDMERIGDQAVDIAGLIEYVDSADIYNGSNISEMAEAAIRMVTESIDAFVKRDVFVAHKVMDDDDRVDAYFVKIKKQLIELIARDPGKGEEVLDILMIAKYLERIGDHAVNIAEWVVFAITGSHDD